LLLQSTLHQTATTTDGVWIEAVAAGVGGVEAVAAVVVSGRLLCQKRANRRYNKGDNREPRRWKLWDGDMYRLSLDLTRDNFM